MEYRLHTAIKWEINKTGKHVLHNARY